MVKVKFSGKFDKMYKELVEGKSDLRNITATRIKLFEKNPEDTRLRNHSLRKHLEGRWAFSITDDIRIIYKWIGKSSVRFLAIGHHKSVYPS